MTIRKDILLIFTAFLISYTGTASIGAQNSTASQQQSTFDLMKESEAPPYNSFLITPTPVFVDPENCRPKKTDLKPIFLLDNHLYGYLSGIWYYIPESPIVDSIINTNIQTLLLSLNNLKAEDAASTPTPAVPVPTTVETEPGSQQQGIIIFETPTPFVIDRSANEVNTAKARMVSRIIADFQKHNFVCPAAINGL